MYISFCFCFFVSFFIKFEKVHSCLGLNMPSTAYCARWACGIDLWCLCDLCWLVQEQLLQSARLMKRWRLPFGWCFCTWQTISKSAWLHDECRFHSKLGDKYLSLSSFGCASQILMIRNNYVIFDCKSMFAIVFEFCVDWGQRTEKSKFLFAFLMFFGGQTSLQHSLRGLGPHAPSMVMCSDCFRNKSIQKQYQLKMWQRKAGGSKITLWRSWLLSTGRCASWSRIGRSNLQARVPRSLQRRPTSPHYTCAEKVSDISDMHTLSPRHLPVTSLTVPLLRLVIFVWGRLWPLSFRFLPNCMILLGLAGE